MYLLSILSNTVTCLVGLLLTTSTQVTTSLPIPENSADIGYILQFSDVHYDVNYTVNGLPPNSRGYCRLNNTGQSHHPDPDHKSASNKSTKSAEKVGFFGTMECDSPYALVQSALISMQATSTQYPFDFILWNGDSLPHDSTYGTTSVIENVQLVTKMIQNTFPNTRIFPVYGNHDYAPVDELPGGPTSVYQEIGKLWGPMIGGDSTTLTLHGYYVKDVSDRLSIMGLNTNMYYVNNPIGPTALGVDPGGQFKWMEGQLKRARSLGRKVIIMAHVPPGWKHHYLDMYKEYNQKYLSILRQYHDVLLPQLYAHLHEDRILIIPDLETNEALGSALMVGSILPAHGFPTYRVIEYDRTTFEFLDIHSYTMDMTKSNAELRPYWSEYYSYSASYGMGSVTTASLANLVGRMHKDNDLFQEYYKNIYPMVEQDHCGSYCTRRHICMAEWPDEDRYLGCRGTKS